MNASRSRGNDHEGEVARLFTEAGWTVSQDAGAADMLVRKGRRTYVVEVKHAREARADRVIPLVAQAILQSKRYAQSLRRGLPLVVLTSDRIPIRLAIQVEEFVRDHAPDVALGIIDSGGLRRFSGEGLEVLNRMPTEAAARKQPRSEQRVHLFSDLNQWMLKVILSIDIPDEHLLNAPRTRYRNASELARGAGVSVMTAFRMIELFKAHGFLHQTPNALRLLRIEELLHHWQTATALETRPVIAAKWLFPANARAQLHSIAGAANADTCVARYAAANALGFGIAKGVATHLYVKSVRMHLARDLGVVLAAPNSEADVLITVPVAMESVFRGAVFAKDIRTCDVVQTWLDVSRDPSRGVEQGTYIYGKVIRPMITRASQW